MGSSIDGFDEVFFVIIREDCIILGGGDALWQCFRFEIFVFISCWLNAFHKNKVILQQPVLDPETCPGSGLQREKSVHVSPLLPCLQEFFHPDSLSKSTANSQDPPHLASLPRKSPDPVQETIMTYPMPTLQLGLCKTRCVQVSFIPAEQDADTKKSALPEALEAASSH